MTTQFRAGLTRSIRSNDALDQLDGFDLFAPNQLGQA